jgi:hypothetical protein
MWEKMTKDEKTLSPTVCCGDVNNVRWIQSRKGKLFNFSLKDMYNFLFTNFHCVKTLKSCGKKEKKEENESVNLENVKCVCFSSHV